MNLKSLSQLPDDLSLALGERPKRLDIQPSATSVVKTSHREDGSALMTLHNGMMAYLPPVEDRLAANLQRQTKQYYKELGDSFNRFNPEGTRTERTTAAPDFFVGQYVYGKRSGLRFRVTAVENGRAQLKYTSPAWVGASADNESFSFDMLRKLVDLERKPKVGDWVESDWGYEPGRRFKITKVEDNVIFVHGCGAGGWARFSDEGSSWEFATEPNKIEPNGLVEAK